jgi:hypothetical protein
LVLYKKLGSVALERQGARSQKPFIAPAMLKSLVTTTLLVTSALALITPRAWPAGNVVCGSTTYTLTQVKAAVTQGYSDYTKGTTVSE